MSFHPIICVVHNNLHLTKKAVQTFRTQDIGIVDILIADNASTDGTNEWFQAQRDLIYTYHDPALSVAAAWNYLLQAVFNVGAEYALVVNNDVELRPDTYRLLVADGGGFVTAVGIRDSDVSQATVNPLAKRPHPDFSCYLIRRETYEKVGPFDENFLIAFGEDWDYHVRLHRSGVTAYCLDLPFLHHGSMTIKNANLPEIRRIQIQAEKNRAYFKAKHGVAGASPEYYALFGNAPPEEQSKHEGDGDQDVHPND